MEEDGLTAAELEQIRICLEERISDALAALQQNDAPVELDQSRVGRLARLDAIQHQQIAKSQVARMRALLPIYRQRLNALMTSPEDFGECILCGELIPLKRLLIRPEVQMCVPCLRASGG